MRYESGIIAFDEFLKVVERQRENDLMELAVPEFKCRTESCILLIVE